MLAAATRRPWCPGRAARGGRRRTDAGPDAGPPRHGPGSRGVGVQHDARPPRVLRRRSARRTATSRGSARPRRRPASIAASRSTARSRSRSPGTWSRAAPPRRPGCSTCVQRRPPVTASSTYGQDPRVAPRFAYDGQPTTAWVSDDGDLYPTLHLPLEEGCARSRGSPSRPDDAGAGRRRGHRGRPHPAGRAHRRHRGRARAGADPPRCVVRFEKAPDAAHVVVPEIDAHRARRSPGRWTRRPRPALSAGSARCSHIDGREVATRVAGTMADVINGSPLALEACDEETGEPIEVELGEGEHRLHATPTADFEVIDLLATAASPLARALGAPGQHRALGRLGTAPPTVACRRGGTALGARELQRRLGRRGRRRGAHAGAGRRLAAGLAAAGGGAGDGGAALPPADDVRRDPAVRAGS